MSEPSNTSMDYINQSLESLRAQLQTILNGCNALFRSQNVSEAYTFTDLPASITELIALIPAAEPEPEPSNEEPGGEENEGV